MSKLNNSRILLAIVLLAVFVICTALSITLLSQKYFTDSKYVGIVRYQDEFYSSKEQRTVMFSDYGQIQITYKNLNDISNERSIRCGTYTFQHFYNQKPYFETNFLGGNFYYRNAFQLENGDTVYTNVSAVCLLTFYLLMTVGSLVGAILLLVHRKNGKKVFYNVARMQAQIDELQKHIDELKKGE